MQEEKRTRLEQKRKALKQKLLVDGENRQLQSYYLPFLETLKKPYSFEYFQCVNEEDKMLWLTEIDKDPWKKFSIPAMAIKIGEPTVHQRMEEEFPGYLAIRYLPCLPFHNEDEQSIHKVLPGAISSLGIEKEEEVFLFFTSYLPVLRLPLASMLNINEYDLPACNDLCIMSKDFSWLIFRSLEDEWRWGTTPLDKKYFNPGKKINLLQSGTCSFSEAGYTLSDMVQRLGTVYDEETFVIQQDLFLKSNADDFLIVLKGNDAWLEFILKKGNCEWKICANQDA